ncbi:MAG: NUDIX domain-containing protein [Candidatus Peribacteria bacterium]|nr:NUDIX domain-containing protein [Candidatus Peribacteria bacterium]
MKTIRLFLMTSAGRLYVQKRSKYKDGNAGMYDKTVGGHVVAGDSFTMTVVKECAEELGFPAVVASEQEFFNAIKVVDLDVIGLFRSVDYLQTFMSERITQNS